MKYFLDTSSWIKRYSGENGFKKIDSLIENELIIIYDLEITELISNLYRLHNEKYITKEELDDIIVLIYKDLSKFTILSHTDSHIFNFEKLCNKLRQTPIDGMIILLAKDMEAIVLVTSDERLKKGAELEKLKVEII